MSQIEGGTVDRGDIGIIKRLEAQIEPRIGLVLDLKPEEIEILFGDELRTILKIVGGVIVVVGTAAGDLVPLIFEIGVILDREVVVDMEVQPEFGVKEVRKRQVLWLNIPFIPINALRPGIRGTQHPSNNAAGPCARITVAGNGCNIRSRGIEVSVSVVGPHVERAVGIFYIVFCALFNYRSRLPGDIGSIVDQVLCDAVRSVPLTVIVMGVIKVPVRREVLVERRCPGKRSIKIVIIVFYIVIITVGFLLLITDSISQFVFDDRTAVIDLLAEIGITALPARGPGSQIQINRRMIRIKEGLLCGVIHVPRRVLSGAIDHARRARDDIGRLVGIGFEGKSNAGIEFLNAVLINLSDAAADRGGSRRGTRAGLRDTRRVFRKVVIRRNGVFLKLPGRDLGNLARRVLHRRIEPVEGTRRQNRQRRLLDRNTLDHDLLQLFSGLATGRCTLRIHFA